MNISNYNTFKQKFPMDSIAAASLREAAYQRLQKNGLPTKKDEAWKYTSTKKFSEINWELPVEEQHLTHEDMKWLSTKLSTDFYNFVFINGAIHQTLSDDFENWISVVDIGESDYLCASAVSEIKLTDLLQATFDRKIKLDILPGKIIDKPIQILFAQKSDGNILSNSMIQFNLGENAQAKLILNFVSLPSAVRSVNAVNIATQINLAQNSNLQFVQMQNENKNDFHFSRTQFKLSSRAQLLSLDLALGGQLSRHYLEAAFCGENAFAGVYGLTALGNDQHGDHYTYIHHQIGLNESIQHYKSILTDSAHSVFRGRVRIEPDAQKANSQQLNNNLLLTQTAQADSVPQLEIYADDVKASHGSTMGQLNADEIFYFLSRGIQQTQAVRMLAHGYALELVYKIEDSQMRQWILKSLNEKMEGIIPNV
jgi:Fe-S cluster assembly protein SufD